MSLEKNPKKFWNINSRKRKDNGIPNIMKLENKVGETPNDIANLFAEYFKSVYSTNMADNDAQFSEMFNNTLCNINVTENEIIKSISTLDANKSGGPDNIPAHIIKHLSQALVKPITSIFNKSLSEGIFPLKFKEGIVQPIHKTGDKHNIRNYRPITLTNTISKIYEKQFYFD